MEEWVHLKTMLEQKKQFSRQYIDYVPDENWTTSQTCENGYNWQYFETEYNLGGYHAFLYQDQVYLISEYATRVKLTVKGDEAYEEILSSIAKIHGLYGCKEIQAIGKPLTSKILNEMPKFLREAYKRAYWLHERVTPLPSEPKTKLLRHVITKGNIITSRLSKTVESKTAYAIRPLILLAPNTYVKLEDKLRGATFESQALKIALDK